MPSSAAGVGPLNGSSRWSATANGPSKGRTGPPRPEAPGTPRIPRATRRAPRPQRRPARSENYVTSRQLAQTAAQAEGAPFVLEYHLLAALLDTPTASLDRALEWLGSSRHALRAALDQVRGGGAGPRSTYSVFS